MKKILLVGCGNIGFWHLISLRQEKIFEIHVLEKNLQRIKYLKKKFNSKNISFISKRNFLHNKFYDLVILATGAEERFLTFKYLCSKLVFKNIIFEKVVFQNYRDLINTKKILKEKNIKGWVNFPRRCYSFFKFIKRRKYKNISFYINGFDWNMCSNTIHFLDLCNYLNIKSFKKINYEFSKEIKKSKKKYVELFGNITYSNNNNYLMLQNFNMKSHIKIIIDIICDHIDKYQIIQFTNGNVSIKKNEKKLKFLFPNQSKLTSKLVKEILFKRKSNLTKFDESIESHEKIFYPINKFLGKNKTNCQIT